MLSFTVFSQSNPFKAADLLDVPQSFAQYDGQIQKKFQYEIVEYRLTDFTNVDTVNGKLVRVPKITSTFKSMPVALTEINPNSADAQAKIDAKHKFGSYALNLVSIYKNGFGYIITSDSTLHKPDKIATIPVGPFTGYTYYFGWSDVAITKGDGVYNYTVTAYPYMNTDKKGFPATQPTVTIRQFNTTRSGSVSIKQRTMTYEVTNMRESSSGFRNVTYTNDEIETMSDWNQYQIANARRTMFQIYPTSATTHVNSIATDIVPTGTKYKGLVYINGIQSNQIAYTSLIASMNKQFPQIVQRWHLYNGEINNSIYGSTWTQQLSATDINDITVVPGSAFNWNENTRTLTYNSSLPAELWYSFECLPAQGKNEGTQTIINLNTGIKRTQ